MNLQDHKSCLATQGRGNPTSPPPLGLSNLSRSSFYFTYRLGQWSHKNKWGNERRGINFHLTRYILCKHLNQQQQQLQQQARQLLYQLAACSFFFFLVFFCFGLFYSFFCLLLTVCFSRLLHVYGFSSHTPCVSVCVCVYNLFVFAAAASSSSAFVLLSLTFPPKTLACVVYVACLERNSNGLCQIVV